MRNFPFQSGVRNFVMIRIVIADDHAVVRTGLQLIFDETSDLVVVGECKNGNELIKRVGDQDVDVVILDVAMPGRDAIDVLKHIKKIQPDLPVIIFTMNSEESYALRFFRNGASAFINKESEPKILIDAIRTVHADKKYFTGSQMEMMSELMSGNQPDKASLHELLTDREFQVLSLIAAGENASVIAEKLNVSKNTISNHRNNILKKLNLKNNSELTRYAINQGIIN
jgi:DNA-binding NarL/FixJ family response regulator